MREAVADGVAPEVERPAAPVAEQNEARFERRRQPSIVTLAALAASTDLTAWTATTLDALESMGLHGAHVLLRRDGQLALVGMRGLPAELEAALRSGGEVAGTAFESLDGGAARIGWLADGAPAPSLSSLIAVAGGALHRLLCTTPVDEFWYAAHALDVEARGAVLLETIATQARRLAQAAHVEVRWVSGTGEVLAACTSGGAAPEERPACCVGAAHEATRLQLRFGKQPHGELLVSGCPLAGGATLQLRRFATLAAGRLEVERLRSEIGLLAREENRTRAREERFEAALANAPVILSTQDRSLRYTWIHRPRYHRPEEITGRTDFDLVLPAEALRLQMLKQRVLDTGEPSHAEVTVTVRGQQRTYQMAVDPVRDPWGAITGVACAAVDITARAREAGVREQLLLQREDERSWLLSVIERSPVGILLFEMEEGDERITANRRAAELLGHAVDPVRARKVVAGRLLHADGSPIALHDLPSSRALRGERVSMEEAQLRRLDGTQIPIVISAGPIVDAAGRQAGAVVTFDDISPFKELERMREQWTSLITHDLRQPITSIAGFASVLAEHPDLPQHLRAKVVHIVAAAKRLGRMTADLLEASRLESNQLALERQPTDLAALVGEVVERLAGELQDHPVQVEQGESLEPLELDPERFEQVLGNLLSNAAKYSLPGSPILVQIDRHGSEAVVGVTNQGGGLPVDELGAIFRRFHRTDAARRSRIRGLGLGLYIARGLVEAHGGRIWVETEPGRSVTFRFALPLALD
ncbi:sensor histidine kinase [Vulgatibacter sp.]|uniref:sensor histidine kinase n=1 Tax=Vulgatibacter sp. TaxID=1971226 RepID=UPI00356520AD